MIGNDYSKIKYDHYQKIDKYKWKHRWNFFFGILRWHLLTKFSIAIHTHTHTHTLVTLSIKITRYRTVFFFLFLIFPLWFPRYISWKYSCQYLSIDLAMENLVSKCHCNISKKKFHRCFHLYLSIFW
jgi:hypothetical protein